MDTRKTDQQLCDNSLIVEKGTPKTHAEYWVAVLVQMNSERKVGTMLSNWGYSYVSVDMKDVKHRV